MAFSGSGSGTEEDPYQITSWAQLQEMNDDLDAHYILMNDLDSNSTGYDTYASSTANGGDGWEPIGDDGSRFTGTFDGDGHTISDLYINRSSNNSGLFGFIGRNGDISNIGLLNIDISANDNTGGLAGETYFATISNCYSTGSVNGDSNMGGLIGKNNGTVSNCYSKASVSGHWYVGGLSGYSTKTTSNCYSTGSVSGNSNVGGLVGYNTGTISSSFWDTETSGKSSSSGGTGKTTSEMQDYDTFNDAGWDIVLIGDYVDENWYINDGNDYPKLGWEYEEPEPTGTNTQINIGDAWKEISAMQINIGDSWKEVSSAQINIGDEWKTIF